MPDPALDLCTCGHVRIDHNNPIGGKCRFPTGCDCLLFERATPPERYERDPVFTPGMVVAAADRNRNDLRTWEAFQPEDAAPGEWWFDPLWRTTVACGWDKRVDLPERLVVVADDGRAAH